MFGDGKLASGFALDHQHLEALFETIEAEARWPQAKRLGGTLAKACTLTDNAILNHCTSLDSVSLSALQLRRPIQALTPIDAEELWLNAMTAALDAISPTRVDLSNKQTSAAS